MRGIPASCGCAAPLPSSSPAVCSKMDEPQRDEDRRARLHRALD